jgi:N-acetyl-beta-hexosaminidase
MTKIKVFIRIIVFVIAMHLFATGISVVAAEQSRPDLLPWPRSVDFGQGSLAVSEDSRIVFSDDKLAALATVLSDEIYMSTAIRLGTQSSNAGRPGDIVFKIDRELADEAYTLTVSDRAIIRGGSDRAVAWGSVTLLQAMDRMDDGSVRLAAMTVEDEPAAPYRALMIDVARQWHPVETLRPLIDMCRLYKIRYMQLHLNDQQSTTFPFKAFPELASSYHGQRRTYTREEITSLVQYADERAVTIIPEINGPGHHSGNLRKLWGHKNHTCLDMASEKTYEGMDIVIGELCEVFQSSPFIHLGADEAWLKGVGESEEEKAFMDKHNISGAGGLYNYYIKRMNEIVKAHGKQTIVWEGFHGVGGGGVTIPNDVIVMVFENRYNTPGNLLKNGYKVINASWTPLYVVNSRKHTPQHIYEWNMYEFGRIVRPDRYDQTHWFRVEPTSDMMGAQMCAWEQVAEIELPSLRTRIPAMSERIWNPAAGKTYADFAERFAVTDDLLDRVLGFIRVETDGLPPQDPEEFAFFINTHGADRVENAAAALKDYKYFKDPIKVELSSLQIGDIRYTTDGSLPTEDSPKYHSPIHLDRESTSHVKLLWNTRIKRHMADGRLAIVKALLFDADGKPLGDAVTIARYLYKPDNADDDPVN